jgi:tRNA threonylcarbamoyladenosine biosynthesis protein TsaB
MTVPENETPLILSIETATRAGSVAVARGETLLAARAGVASVSHSSHLLEHLGNVLEESGETLHNVNVFAVASGPGSFTGLRIGLATVKSFAATLNRQCVGVPTLFAVARAAGESAGTVALLPAGRGEVFAQLLAVDRNGDVQPLSAPTHLSPRELLERFSGLRSLKWTGEGAQIHADAIKARALTEGIAFSSELENGHAEQRHKQTWTLAPSSTILAAEVAGLAYLRVRAGDTVPPQQLRAIYVRPSDAELNQRCQE